MMRAMRVSVLALAAACLVLGGAATAQDRYPSRPIKVVVPYGPGSATDIVIRIVGEQARQVLGQPLIIENKPGAFGIIAIEEMARAKPDGYTLQVGNAGTNQVAPIIYKKKFTIDYDKEVAIVTQLTDVPLFLAATTKDFPPTTFEEFIAYAKANPGKVRYASVGIGSNNHYDTEAFAQAAGIRLLHIPVKSGGAGITNELVTGDAQVAFVNAASSVALVKAGTLRALAIMAPSRLSDFPAVRTLSELGFTGVGSGLWAALYAPAATPRPVLETLHKAMVASLNSPPVLDAFKKQMINAAPSATLEDAQAWSRRELAYWIRVISEVKVELPE
jgi:tripartite-type tricarboxylate transporter receptor subunit TctC